MKTKSCKLQNLISGRIITGKSIVDFCRKARLWKDGKNHVTPVLQEKRLHYKNWCLPKIYKILNTQKTIYDIYGNQYKITGIELSKKTKMELINVYRLLIGEKSIFRGFSLIQDFPLIAPQKHKIKKIVFIKDSKKYEGETGTEIAQKIGVSPWSVYNVIHGKQFSTKGFTAYKVETEQKSLL